MSLFLAWAASEAHIHCSSLGPKLLKTRTLSCFVLNLMDTLAQLPRCVILQEWKAFPLMHAYRSTLSLCAYKGKLRSHALKVILRSIEPSEYTLVVAWICRSQWLRGLRHRSAAALLLRSWVWIPPWHGCLSVVSVVCCQVEVSATNWSLVQRSPTDCAASLCVI
jgi:hypothetical protein